jgi:hypothetical protein
LVTNFTLLEGGIYPMAERKRRSYGVSREEFCFTWQNSNSTKEAVDKLTVLCRERGKLAADEVIKPNIVLARVSTYRKRGVDLKQMPRGNGSGNRIDVEALNGMLHGTVAANEQLAQS